MSELDDRGTAVCVMKNWEPFVFGPAFAMDTIPGPECLSSGWNSSSNR